MKRKKILVLIVLLAALGTASWLGFKTFLEGKSQNYDYTGTIETTLVPVQPEQGGKLTEVLVQEGQLVQAGQVLVRLDDRAAKISLETAQALGMHPYYLYRQKHIAGNLENIGFVLPGAECSYNIGIMEERQTVIGIGAGASSKIVNPKDYSLVNLQHPSNWQVYLERWKEIHQTRAMKLSIDK